MGATFNRLKNWVEEILSYADLNAEIDNILDNLSPTGVDDHSTNLAQMRLIRAPLDSESSEVLAESLAEELEQLRYQIKAILGDEDYWYSAPATTLSGLNTLLTGGTTPSSRVESIGSTAYANKLIPDGTASTITLEADATANIIYYINDVRYNLTADVSLTSLSQPPSTNNTASFDGTAYSATHASTYLGEHDTSILLTSVGSNISSNTNQEAYKVVRGGTTEYFTAQYDSSTTSLVKARRGMFFDENNASIERSTIETADTITVCNLVWLFLTSSQTLGATYNTPTWGFDEPSTPSTGDYWFDQNTTTWKIYDSTNWVESDAVYIGQAVMDGTACVGGRLVEPFKTYGDTNEMDLEVGPTTASLQLKELESKISVYGINYDFGRQANLWNASRLEGGGTLATAGTYYAYVKEDGDFYLSTLAPHDRRGDLAGFYHPSKSWRCVGYCETSGGVFDSSTLQYFSLNNEMNFKGRVTYREVERANYVVSSGSGSFTNTTGTYADVTNLSVTFTARGRPYIITLGADSTVSDCFIGASGSSTEAGNRLKIVRDGSVDVSVHTVYGVNNGTSSAEFIYVPPGSLTHLETTALNGTYTYKIQSRTIGGSGTITARVNNCKLIIYELF